MSAPRARRGPLPLAAAVLLVLGVLAVTTASEPEPVPSSLRLLDLDGKVLDPIREASGPVAFVFVRTDCPIANRYAPELRRLRDDYADDGIRVFLVYADPDETPERIREHLAAYGHTAPALRDPHHDLVRRTGVRITPEAAVFTRAGKLIYRGRIDNRHEDYGRSRPRATVTDVRDVLDSLVDGERPAFRSTRAVGCFIAPLEAP